MLLLALTSAGLAGSAQALPLAGGTVQPAAAGAGSFAELTGANTNPLDQKLSVFESSPPPSGHVVLAWAPDRSLARFDSKPYRSGWNHRGGPEARPGSIPAAGLYWQQPVGNARLPAGNASEPDEWIMFIAGPGVISMIARRSRNA